MTNQIQNKRDSFIFYRSFFNATKCLKNDEKAQLFDAICSYALDENFCEINGAAAGMFELIKPQLDANRKRFKNGCIKKQKRSKKEAKYKRTESKSEANDNVNVNVNVNDNLNDLKKEKEKEKKENLESDFENWWKDYNPIKTKDGRVVDKGSKKTAQISYERARKKHSTETIYNGTQAYLERCYNNNQLSCGAAVCLNQERFLIEEQEIIQIK